MLMFTFLYISMQSQTSLYIWCVACAQRSCSTNIISSTEIGMFRGAAGTLYESARSPHRQAQSACMSRSEPTFADVRDFLQTCQEPCLLFHALWLCMYLFTGLLICLGHHTVAATLCWSKAIKPSALWESMSWSREQIADRARRKVASV